MWPNLTVFVLLSAVFSFIISGVESLQCFQCSGQTNYDPDDCFNPMEGKTIAMECPRGSICEKRIERIDRAHRKIDRGCTANCDGRTYVYTDDFQVHCCDDNYCNGAERTLRTNNGVVLSVGLVVYLGTWWKYL